MGKRRSALRWFWAYEWVILAIMTVLAGWGFYYGLHASWTFGIWKGMTTGLLFGLFAYALTMRRRYFRALETSGRIWQATKRRDKPGETREQLHKPAGMQATIGGRMEKIVRGLAYATAQVCYGIPAGPMGN